MYSNTQNARRRPGITGNDSRPRSDSVTTSPGSTSRISSAPIRSNAQVSEATQYPSVLPSGATTRPIDSGRRPCGSRNATTHSSVITTVENAPCIRGRISASASCTLLRRMRAEQRGDDLRVRRGPKRNVLSAQLGVQLDGVDQIAVVRQRQRTPVVAHDRLGVLPLRGTGGRVTDVADRHVARQRAQHVIVEHLRDQSLVTDREDRPTLRGGRDPGRLLPAMLQRVQREVRQARDIVAGCVQPEHAAFVTRSVAMVEGMSHLRAVLVSLATAAPAAVHEPRRFRKLRARRCRPATANRRRRCRSRPGRPAPRARRRR